MDQKTGNELLSFFEALSNRHRLRIVALLYHEKKYVSQLARDLGMSRPLVYMHLNRLEEANIVKSERVLSEDGKAMNYYTLLPIQEEVTAKSIESAVQTLTSHKEEK